MKTNTPIDRRNFLKTTSTVLACFWTGAIAVPLRGSAHAASLQSDASAGLNIIGPREPFPPQIGTLISMLNWMRSAILQPVQGLTMADLDYLSDSKANTIGALLLHLAATDRHYQIHTFEGRKWNDWDDETKRRWGVPGALGDEARKVIKGHELAYYLEVLKEVREQTLTELQKRDDAWLMQVDPDWPWGPTNNFCKWFHVCEHESHHSGQISWLKRRLPGAAQSAE